MTETTEGWAICNLETAFTATRAVDYVVQGMFLQPSLNIIYGAPGTFKSLLMADLALHVAAGRPWLSHQADPGFATQKAHVLWIDVDNGRWRTANRFRALALERGVGPDAPLSYVSMPAPPLMGNDATSMLMLRDLMLDYRVSLCVIDNLGLITGGVDENSSLMSVVMANLRALADRANAALVLIHHQRKGAAAGRTGDALRGHSSIEASLDLALQVLREDEAPSCRIRSTKSRDVPFNEIAVEFHYTSGPDKFTLQRAGFLPRPLETGADKRGRLKEAILSTLASHQNGIPKTRLAQAVHDGHDGMPGLNVIRGLIDELCETGALLGRQEGRAFIIRQPDSMPRLPIDN